jgi:cellobiose-specific phosphotransferase system component IIB
VALVIDDHLMIVHLAGMTVGWLAQQVAESAVYNNGRLVLPRGARVG